MTTTSAVISLPVRSTYGAVEVKEFIRKSTYRAFIITVSLLILLFLIYFVVGMISSRTVIIRKAPLNTSIDLKNYQQTQEADNQPPPPPAESIVQDVATAAKAGTPVPVPEADIKEELKTFANVDDMSKSLSREQGNIVDISQVQNINLGEEKIKVQIEKEPEPDEFIPVEKEPFIDLGELQRKVVYPEMARKANIEGKVTVRVLVGKDGRPVKCLIEQSESSMLDDAAKSAVMHSVFSPGIQNRQPVVCWVSIPIKFKLR